MDSKDLPHACHQRLHLPDYEEKLSELDPRTLDTGEADSPSQVWGRERLRAAMDLSGIHQVPVDLLVWGRGAPSHPAGTKIEGMPVWPAVRPLPLEERNDWETPAQLRFLTQVNFADSLDILPELPGQMLSIWGTEDFPHGENSMLTFWLDLEGLELAVEYAPGFSWDFMPQIPFFAALHRSWDRSHPQELFDEAEGQEARDTDFCTTSWMASKIGNRSGFCQWSAGPNQTRCLREREDYEFRHGGMGVIQPRGHFVLDLEPGTRNWYPTMAAVPCSSAGPRR